MLLLCILNGNWVTVDEILSAKMWFSLLPIRKLSLVNETLRPETETRPRRLTFSPRRDRDRDVPTFRRDRDETETLTKCVSRPSRDRDVETETTSLVLAINNNLVISCPHGVFVLIRNWFLPGDATQSAVMPQYVACPSVSLPVRDVQVQWSHRLEYFENNFTAE